MKSFLSSCRKNLSAVRSLLAVRLRGIWSRLRRAEFSERIRNSLLALIFVLFMVSLTYLGNMLFTRFLQIPLLGRFLMLQTLSFIFLSFFILLVFSSLVTGLGAGYMSSDLDGLFSSPIDSTAVFWAKLLEATFHSTWMVLIFGYPILVSYGYTAGAPWYFYLLAFLIMFPFISIPATLGFFLVVALLYWVPIKRIRSVIVGVAITFGLLLIYILRLFSPQILVEPEIARQLFFRFLGDFEIARITGLPSYHAAYFLHGLTGSEANFLWGQLFWLLGLTGGTVLVCGWLGGHWYKAGWLHSREGEGHQRSASPLGRLGKIFNFLPRPYNALSRKETLLFARETTQWSQLLVLVGIVIVHVFNLSELTDAGPIITYLLYFGNIVLIGFVLTAICVRFVFPSLSFEGKSFWIIRSGPLSMRKLFFFKTTFYLIPLLLLGVALIFLTNWLLPVSPRLVGWSILFISSLTVALTAGALAMGALFPEFEYEHFAEVVTGPGSVLYMLCGLFYVAGATGATTLPLIARVRTAAPEKWEDIFRTSGFEATVVGLSAFSILLGVIFFWIAARAIKNYNFTEA